MSLFLAALGLCCWSDFSLVSASGGCFVVVVQPRCGASLVEHRLEGTWGSAVVAPVLYSAGSVVVHGLTCPMIRGIFPDQGSNLCPLRWSVNSLPLGYQGSPAHSF